MRRDMCPNLGVGQKLTTTNSKIKLSCKGQKVAKLVYYFGVKS